MQICPCCCHSLTSSMSHDRGNPVIVYSCENCRYTTFGEAYRSYSVSLVTVGTGSNNCMGSNTYNVSTERHSSKRKSNKVRSAFIPNDFGRGN